MGSKIENVAKAIQGAVRLFWQEMFATYMWKNGYILVDKFKGEIKASKQKRKAQVKIILNDLNVYFEMTFAIKD